VQLDASLGFSKPRPRKQRQAQIDGAGIQSIDGFVELDTEIFIDVKRSGLLNEQLGKIGVDASISIFVGIGQCAARDFAAKTRVVKLLFESPKAALDIPQAFAESQLRKGHA
jgi:hypothetical protein